MPEVTVLRDLCVGAAVQDAVVGENRELVRS